MHEELQHTNASAATHHVDGADDDCVEQGGAFAGAQGVEDDGHVWVSGWVNGWLRGWVVGGFEELIGE